MNIAIEAIERGYEVGLICKSGKDKAFIVKKGIKVFEWSLSRTSLNPLNHIRSVFQIFNSFRVFRPDLIHAVAIKPLIFSALVSKLFGMKNRVFALGGLGFIFSSEKLLAKILRPLIVFLLKYCLSGNNTRLIIQNIDDCKIIWGLKIIEEGRTRLIEGAGVDIQRFKPENSNPEEIPIVVLPARFLWDKGIGEFVEAAEIIKSKSILAKFVLVGGPDSHNPENIDSEVIDGWIKNGLIESWGFRNDMPNVIKASSIICLPSYREGIPKCLIEAASCGKPIVTTNVPGCREVVTHGLNGYLVNARSSEELAIFLEKLILDKKLRLSMGSEGRNIAIKRFSEELIVKQTRKVWEEVLL